MSDIKSAREIAEEKLKQIGEPTEEERLKWKYSPQGEELAARYLKEECNLLTELGQYPENVKPFVIEGANEVLIRNINLPKDDSDKKTNRKVMDGIKTLKSDKVTVENTYSQIRNIFNHYAEQGDQQKKQAYESLKAEVEARMQQEIQQQLGTFTGVKIDVEKQPQFQHEWRRILAQLDSQYINLLNEYKRELSAIT
ncbi:MAG: hypothetical protein JSW16_01750 [Dehalococcoidales bacterium]|nr:MAG: hypothetical protein JSW16_01750 [Dehalococcoidales bacterium]